jgi:hypothetical protein
MSSGENGDTHHSVTEKPIEAKTETKLASIGQKPDTHSSAPYGDNKNEQASTLFGMNSHYEGTFKNAFQHLLELYP